VTSLFLGPPNRVAQPLLERLFFTMSISFSYFDVPSPDVLASGVFSKTHYSLNNF
jgi:hypothetical protein